MASPENAGEESQPPEAPSPIQFLAFSSTVESPFWVHYSKLKLETIRLSEEPISLVATYGVGSSRLQLVESSLGANSNENTPVASQNEGATTGNIKNDRILAKGKLLGFNTLESFSKCDKNRLLQEHIHEDFVVATFNDLKAHKILYWFGFPVRLGPTQYSWEQVEPTCTTVPQQIHEWRLQNLEMDLPPFFVITSDATRPWLLNESDPTVIKDVLSRDDATIVVMDTAPASACSEKVVFGWPLRRLLAKLVLDYEMLGQFNICSWKAPLRRVDASASALSDDAIAAISSQLVFIRLALPAPSQYSADKVVGWEYNAARQKPGPKWINLSPLLDPQHLAIQAADLNLKLMKWRMLPALQVSMLQEQKVLLLGAGTLGCSVARTLIGWGVRKMTLLDYGNVSYSNPVRQNLFTLDDCHGAGKLKAQAAAEALEKIAANMEVEAVRLSIPMPGHAETMEVIEETVTKLDKLIQDADIIYLLTDTRESRWLPTLMAAAHDKVLLNAALGLDSWLVMRHGGGSGHDGPRLGCYFCNDVVAPENSTKNRTLDQQCTVTRPGLAPIAASMAVELMVALLHHPLKQRAPAPKSVTGNSDYNPTANTEDEASSAGALGIMPHQIRGSLVSYQMMTPTVPAFNCCTGCSPHLIEEYHKDKVGLVYEVCKSTDGSYLEDRTGLTAFRAEAAEKLAALEEDEDLWDDDGEL